MALMQVIVDGTVTFEGQVADMAATPFDSMPDDITKHIGSLPPSQVRIIILTALIESVRRALESPVLKPIEVDIQTHGMGKVTMAVDMGMPSGQGFPT